MAEIIVTNYAEFKAAIVNPDYDTVSLGNNIIFDVSGGVIVPRSRGDVTINGNGYTLTDYNSNAASNGIRIQDTANPAITVTFKDIVWSGRNFYGLAWTSEGTNGRNCTYVLDNVTYTGPQPIFNRYGKTIVRNSRFTLTQNGGPGASQEFCETNRLEIEGRVDIDSVSPSTSCIWLTQTDTSMYVHPNAELNIHTHDSYIFYFDGSRPTIEFGENSMTYIQTYSGFYISGSDTLQTPQSFIVRSGASFIGINYGREYLVPTFKVYQTFTVESDATFILAATRAASSATLQPLFRFNNAANMTVTNPKNFLLYSNGGNLFSFGYYSSSNPNRLNLTANQINNWLAPTLPFESAGGIDDVPTNHFQKADGTATNVTYTCNTSATLQVTSNILSGDSGYPLTTSNFSAFSYKVLSMGKLPLDVEKVTDISQLISGETDPETQVRLTMPSGVQNTVSDSGGAFDFTIEPITVGTTGTVTAGKMFLRQTSIFRVYGSVTLTHTEEILFRTTVVPHHPSMVKRVNTDMYLEVTDTRDDEKEWHLYASLPTPLENDGSQLVDALCLVEDTTRTVNATPILIASGTSSADDPVVITRISWDATHGFLLFLQPTTHYPLGQYTANIVWTLEETE